MNPKVSILVPVYGVEEYIERCAVSLFEQTFDDIEYVFVNGVMTVKGKEVLDVNAGKTIKSECELWKWE